MTGCAQQYRSCQKIAKAYDRRVKLRKDANRIPFPMLKLCMQCSRHGVVVVRDSVVLTLMLTALIAVTLTLVRPASAAQANPSISAQVVKAVGTLKSASADSIVITPESGDEITAKLTNATKILQVPPGEKDLKNATTIQAQDLQPGDRVLVRGQASADAHTISALAVIVMKQADVSAMHKRDLDEWQKTGVGGIVTKVDSSGGVITISSGGLGASHDVAVHVAKNTILRRYAPDSVKFDDAKPAPIDQIKAGDQLRARGNRSADGGEIAATEVVTGSFRNIAGTIKAIDTASNSLTVQDAIGKSAVTVKISPDSQMKKLPAELAQRVAMRLKNAAAGTNGERSGANSQSQNQSARGQGTPPASARPASDPGGSHGAGVVGQGGGNGPPDLQRVLARLPNSTLADLQKGDAVIIVSTQGGDSGSVTAITLVAGVDAILTAAPNRSASSLLSPWSLNASGGEGEGSPQ